MIRKIYHGLKRWAGKIAGPFMIYGFRSADGSWRPNTRFGSSVLFLSKRKIEMGDYVFIAQGCFLDASNGLAIGDGCQITSWVSLLSHSSHISIRLYGAAYGSDNMIGYVRDRTEIGAYSFIGPHAILMPGVRLGKGTLVAAFSYVSGAFPDFAIVAGNPAKVVGDTRQLDEPYLEANPELRKFYEQWAFDAKDSSVNKAN